MSLIKIQAVFSQGFILLCVFGLWLGCADSNLPKSYQLGGVRVLAIKANLPEVNVGDSVVVQALVSDLEGDGRELTYEYEACTDPGVALGASVTCEHDSSKQTSQGKHSFSNNRYTGEIPAFTFVVPSNLLDEKSATDQMNGVPYLVTLKVTASKLTGEIQEFKSFRRILVSSASKSAKNKNPSITDVQIDSVSVATLPREAKKIRPIITPELNNGAEEYFIYAKSTNPLELGATTPQTEKMTLSWFVSEGKFEFSRTEPSSEGNLYTPLSADAVTKPEFIVIVLHDNRGGVSYIGVPSL